MDKTIEIKTSFDNTGFEKAKNLRNEDSQFFKSDNDDVFEDDPRSEEKESDWD
jgi:hypothetical protein